MDYPVGYVFLLNVKIIDVYNFSKEFGIKMITTLCQLWDRITTSTTTTTSLQQNTHTSRIQVILKHRYSLLKIIIIINLTVLNPDLNCIKTYRSK